MKKYISLYIKKIEEKIENQHKYVDKEIVESLVLKIQFFQHERFIHLFVTLSFSFFTLLFLLLGMVSYLFLIPFFILIVFLLFYIVHYFYLENSVQYLYRLYDKIVLLTNDK